MDADVQLTYHVLAPAGVLHVTHTQVLHMGQMHAGPTLGIQRTVSPLPRDVARNRAVRRSNLCWTQAACSGWLAKKLA